MKYFIVDLIKLVQDLYVEKYTMLMKGRLSTEVEISIQTLLEKEWQPTPVFLPGESHRQRSLVGCCLWVAQGQA